MTDAALDEERAHLVLAQECLQAMRRVAAGSIEAGADAIALKALEKTRSERLFTLGDDDGSQAFFGRIDRDPETGTRDEVFHLGRRHIRDGRGDPVVIDWRAPIARGFYQATPAERMGVRLRRRFGYRDGVLSSYEDERLDAGESLGLGSDVLREEIERPRVGPMRDIVATIQPDQDVLVRAGMDDSLCIQGAPGTGKTAVGLHRAAYLLYAFPQRLRRSGVLVVGPNAAFLHYIAQVLPSLGEGGIEQTTIDGLVGVTSRRHSDDVELATLKGDERMAGVLRRAVESHVGEPHDDLVVVVGTKRYRIPIHRLRKHVRDAAEGTTRWALTRDWLRQQIAFDVRRMREASGGAPSDAETARVAKSAAVRGFVDQVWPVLVPRALLVRLYTEPSFLASCATGLLDADEQSRLSWSIPPRSIKAAHFTPQDLVLVDELAGLIDAPSTFVHVVVDEAQDLSAMQCRVIARRCPTGSITVLGDLAQATTAWAPGSWKQTLNHLGHNDAEIRYLTAGYRVPMPVLELANRLLPHIAPEVPAATSIRLGEHALRYAPRDELVDVAREVTGYEGSLGIIVADADVRPTLSSLCGAGIDARLLEDAEDHSITVVPATAAKGLEFDTVLLLEPAAIVAAEARRSDGLRRLYVTLTRAVSHLAIVHDKPLPAELID